MPVRSTPVSGTIAGVLAVPVTAGRRQRWNHRAGRNDPVLRLGGPGWRCCGDRDFRGRRGCAPERWWDISGSRRGRRTHRWFSFVAVAVGVRVGLFGCSLVAVGVGVAVSAGVLVGVAVSVWRAAWFCGCRRTGFGRYLNWGCRRWCWRFSMALRRAGSLYWLRCSGCIGFGWTWTESWASGWRIRIIWRLGLGRGAGLGRLRGFFAGDLALVAPELTFPRMGGLLKRPELVFSGSSNSWG